MAIFCYFGSFFTKSGVFCGCGVGFFNQSGDLTLTQSDDLGQYGVGLFFVMLLFLWPRFFYSVFLVFIVARSFCGLGLFLVR